MKSTKELQFTFIADDRWNESKQSLIEWDSELKEKIKGKGEVTYESNTRKLHFGKPENGCEQKGNGNENQENTCH